MVRRCIYNASQPFHSWLTINACPHAKGGQWDTAAQWLRKKKRLTISMFQGLYRAITKLFYEEQILLKALTILFLPLERDRLTYASSLGSHSPLSPVAVQLLTPFHSGVIMPSYLSWVTRCIQEETYWVNNWPQWKEETRKGTLFLASCRCQPGLNLALRPWGFIIGRLQSDSIT